MQVTCAMELKSTSPIENKKSYMAFMPAVVVAAGIAVLSLAEASQMPSAQVNDKLVHGVMYLALAVTLMGGFAYIRRATAPYYILTCVLAILYGGAMEVLQRYCTLTRSADFMDLLADGIGAVAGVTLFYLIRTFVHR